MVDYNGDIQLNVADEENQYLTFKLAGEVFAMPVSNVREIQTYQQDAVCSMPQVPGFILGVVNLRGSIVPVFDLNVRLGRTAQPITRRTCIVITELELAQQHCVIGLVVDKVMDVLDILQQDIGPVPVFGSNIRTEFIRGMGKVQAHLVIILEIQKVLSGDEITVMAQLQEPDGQND